MNEFQLIPEQASTIAAETDLLTLTLTLIAVFFTGIITLAVVYLSIKYRASAHPKPEPVHGSMLLEITWTVIPLIICMGLFWWGTKLFMKTMIPPEEGMQFYVTGKQWMWKIQHPTGHREINTLHVPIDTNIKLKMTSEDVIHDFYVPAFRTKNDVIPGYYTELWFNATKEGSYHLFCAEYCGTEHSLMIGKVHVLSQENYDKWLRQQTEVEPLSTVGQLLFERHRCNSCHGDQNSELGPSLHGLVGSQVQLAGGGSVEFDHEYFKTSVTQPSADITEGYTADRMPSYKNQLTEEEMFQLYEYVRSLGAEQEVAAANSGSDRGDNE